MDILEIDHLSVGYGGIPLYSDLCLKVERGDYLCIVGENGSGKSTFVRTLLGLQPPMGGQICFGGELRRNEIGYLPQQTLVQRDFPATVREIVLSGRQGKRGLRPFYSAEDRGEALRNMERVHITDLRNRCYRELSGGQQQRVLLARALCAAQEMLLLDEPVAGLDPVATEEMYDIVQELNRDGMTILMVTHDVGAPEKYASCVLHLLGGGEYRFSRKGGRS